MRMGATGRFFAAAALGGGAMILAPAACLFPSYTFDLSSSSSSSGSGGSSTSAGTTSTTASTGTTGTGGAPPMMEDCLNGVDDNGDGKVDCEDPECQADYECVDPAPTGWSANGYLALYEGASGQTPPDCPAGMPTTAFTGNATLNAQGAVCTPCGCGSPTGQDCQLTGDLNPTAGGIQAMQVSNAACLTAATQLSTLTVPDPPWGGACFHDEALAGGQLCNGAPCNTSVSSSLPTVTGGTCLPTGGVASKAAPTWATSAVACHGTLAGKGCANQQVCQPRPKNPFKAHVCIEQSGDVACPAGSSFSNKSVYFSGFTDTRDCTGCNCGPASGGSCEITLSLYSDPAVGACNTLVTSFKAGQCTALNGNPGIYGWTDQITKAPQGGNCMPITVTTPFGTVVEKGPTTFCCL
jgi:hypothetical protein